jgi:hypothetical protein
MNYENYRPYCKTTTQHEAIDALISSQGNHAEAARSLNKSRNAVSEVFARIKEQAASQGYSPEHQFVQTVPSPFRVKKITTQFDEEGNVKTQWVGAVNEGISQELIDSILEGLKADLPTPHTKAPAGNFDTDIVPWINIGDAHLGMLAHSAEVHENFDIRIATNEIIEAFTLLIDRLPQSERCVINDLGDFTHTEVNSNRTEASGHSLDVDGRYYKIADAYAYIMRFIIEYSRIKFKYVDVIINQGNHSQTTDMITSKFLSMMYENVPSVTILNNSSVFIPYRMGNTFVLCHHGHKTKMERMTNVMVHDYRHQMDARFKYIYTGHIHNNKVLAESHGIVTESFNQLAPNDKYSFEGGWRSRKCITAVLLSRTYGEQGRIVVSVDEVKDLLDRLDPGTTSLKQTPVYSV